MAEAEEKNPETADNGGADTRLHALVAKLEAELRRAAPRGSARGSTAWLDARSAAERTWRVTADRPRPHRGGAAGAVQRPVKAAVRKLARWYVEPVFADQAAFNATLLRLVDALHAENERLRRALERQQ